MPPRSRTPRTRTPKPGSRSAEQIAVTATGPRPVPALRTTPTRRPPAYRTAVLDNGLQVLAVRKPGTPLAELRLRVPFGNRTHVQAARAELLAATLLLGTGSRSRERVDADLATVGGHLGTGLDPQRLVISGSVLAPGLPLLLDVLADSLTDPAFHKRDVAGERERLLEHLAVSGSQPSVVARMLLQERRFGDHPAAWDMPDPQLVAALTPAAVRERHRNGVVPRGSILVLVGDLSPAKAIEQAATALAGWTSRGTARPLTTPPWIDAGPVQLHHRENAVQTQIRLTAPAVPRTDPGYAAAQLANLVYGGFFSSRLVENIREDKGYTYSAHSSLEFWPGRAAITVGFDTNTASTAAALLETRYELGRLALTPPTAAEVEAARNYALGTLATSLSTQAGLASTLSALAGHGLDITWLREHPARLRAVGVDDVTAAAARVLAPSNFTGVVLGDADAVGSALDRIGGVVRA
ncbi:insulinase family protein [Nakamurella sp. YIM 132087]|uniref:Insulinase family protein n=1 Tax=Nakamurella alba TaxID=2665158 RepID=A0A7K1FIB7_9ACTN|nr:pitrilysin family protein [Nakamurella alba]MTD13189.1 insulinase family protein [Nakamurella alba]